MTQLEYAVTDRAEDEEELHVLAEQILYSIDHKRLQRLREKKMAMGHKWNDHEDEQNQGMGGMGGM